MATRYAEAHYGGATALVERRRALLRQMVVSPAQLIAVERPLQYHLYVLANLADYGEWPPLSIPGQWVFLASRLLSQDPARFAAGARFGEEWLAKGNGRGVVARDVLALCPTLKLEDLLAMYERAPGVRAHLFEIWRRQGSHVPSTLARNASSPGSDRATRASALAYLAEQPDTDLAPFRRVYKNLINGTASGGLVDERTLTAALWGGIIRGDRDAVEVLHWYLQEMPRAQLYPMLTRMAALTGDPLFFPLLRDAFFAHPASGAWLLVLYGRKEVMPIVLRAMSQARYLSPAAQAWQWLTGELLPRRARLQLVGRECGVTHLAMDAGRVPDREAAERWWAEHHSSWPAEERRIWGAAADVPWLAELAAHQGGRLGRFIQDYLTVKAGPLPTDAATWYSVKRRALTAYARERTSRVVPASVSSARGTAGE